MDRATMFHFMTLLPELRCLIYPHMLAAGTTAILRTSKIYNEARANLYNSAFVRKRYHVRLNNVADNIVHYAKSRGDCVV